MLIEMELIHNELILVIPIFTFDPDSHNYTWDPNTGVVLKIRE